MAMYQIECAYTCHTGNIRANNEDNFWCFGESLPVNNEGTCLLYTSDAADDLLCVDLGGRRIIKKKKKKG